MNGSKEEVRKYDFAIEKIKEMQERNLTAEQMISELELEKHPFLPVIGYKFFDK